MAVRGNRSDPRRLSITFMVPPVFSAAPRLAQTMQYPVTVPRGYRFYRNPAVHAIRTGTWRHPRYRPVSLITGRALVMPSPSLLSSDSGARWDGRKARMSWASLAFRVAFLGGNMRTLLMCVLYCVTGARQRHLDGFPYLWGPVYFLFFVWCSPTCHPALAYSTQPPFP